MTEFQDHTYFSNPELYRESLAMAMLVEAKRELLRRISHGERNGISRDEVLEIYSQVIESIKEDELKTVADMYEQLAQENGI